MNAKELAEKMLEYSDAQAKANRLREEIVAAVLEIGKTQTVGNVKAQFRNGRKTYDYRAGADDPRVSEAAVAQFTTQPPPRVDWRGICKHVGIDNVPFTVSEPSVSVSLLED